MKNLFKNLFNPIKREKDKTDLLFERNDNLVNINQKKQVLKNSNNEYDNLNMLNDLSLNEKAYLERELDFKYDCTNYKLLKIIRTDSTCFEVYCEIDVDGKKQKVCEKILYSDIKDKSKVI